MHSLHADSISKHNVSNDFGSCQGYIKHSKNLILEVCIFKHVIQTHSVKGLSDCLMKVGRLTNTITDPVICNDEYQQARCNGVFVVVLF